MQNVPGLETSKQKPAGNGDISGFVEGSKFVSQLDSSDGPRPGLSRQSSMAAADQVSSQPDLRDTAMLQRCRAVVVDLGNSCWTHRHFSEDSIGLQKY